MSLKNSLKKVSEYKFILPKQGNMKVPVHFFISEKLLQHLEEEAIKQSLNVATLPGIQKAVMVMSDVHTGYGFPIGGVAAFDYEQGIITPGGIGFDINCLTGDSKILTSQGCWKFLRDVNLGELLQVFEFENRSLKTAEVGAVLKKVDKVFKVKTLFGLELKASGDHPVLTDKGFKLVKDLKPGDRVVTFHFDGVEFEKPEDFEILTIKDFPESIARVLKSKNLLPLTSTHEKLGVILKLAAFLTGDGCLYYSQSKGFITVYGNYEVLKSVSKDFEELGFKPRIYSRLRSHKIKTLYGGVSFKTVEHALRINSKALTMFFEKLGVPVGNKAKQSFRVPEFLFKLPKWLKRLYLASFFGAEMNKPLGFKKWFPSMAVSVNKKQGFVKIQDSETFLQGIQKLLAEFGVKSRVLNPRLSYVNNEGVKSFVFKLLINSKTENLETFFSKIGFEYDLEKKALASIATAYLRFKKLALNARKDLASMIIALKQSGVSSTAIKQRFSSVVNKRFIERSLYEHVSDRRISKSFPNFEDFKQQYHLGNGFVLDIVETVEHAGFETVYDLTMLDENHNFIANNFVVSNCGVRLLKTPLTVQQVMPKIKELLEVLFRNVPSGVGRDSFLTLSNSQLDEVLGLGAKWVVSQGYGLDQDLKHTESYGSLSIAKPEFVSAKARARGRSQLGTLGAGNHFLEVQVVDQVYNERVAEAFGLRQGMVTVMIHCGSRGLGHQVCSDYLRLMEDKFPDIVKKLPDRELVYAPLNTELASQYLGAMTASANFAWANRQLIAHQVRKSFAKVFGLQEEDIQQLYDVAHNIAKIEKHNIDGVSKKVIVHRKGATRAFPPGHEELVEAFKPVGQPVLIPGSMGTASYVLVGTEQAMIESFGSTCHGAGRVMSRAKALKQFRGEQVKHALEKQNIFVRSASWKGISEEVPQVYKDIDEVVRVVHKAGIAKLVVRLKPLGVIKG